MLSEPQLIVGEGKATWVWLSKKGQKRLKLAAVYINVPMNVKVCLGQEVAAVVYRHWDRTRQMDWICKVQARCIHDTEVA